MEQSEIEEIVDKYEQEIAAHKQDKDLQELYLSEKNILLELHEKECAPICITTEIVNIERESSKIIIEHQEKRIQSLEKKIERMKNSMTKKIDIDNLKDELLQYKSRYQDFQEKYLNQCIALEQTKDLVGNLSDKNRLFKALVAKLQNEKNELTKKLIKVRNFLDKRTSESNTHQETQNGSDSCEADLKNNVRNVEIWSWKHETIKLSKLETIKDLVQKHNLECKLLECATKQYQSELKDLQERFDNEVERANELKEKYEEECFAHSKDNELKEIYKSQIKSAICNICLRAFRYEAELKSHIKNTHDPKFALKMPKNIEKSKVTVCKVCYRVFQCNMDLQSHLEKIHNQKLNEELPGLNELLKTERNRSNSCSIPSESAAKRRKLNSEGDLPIILKNPFVQISGNESSEARALHEKTAKRLKETRIELQELQAKYDNLRAYLKTSQEREEKVYMEMNSQLKLSEPELKSWKEKYEKETAAHKQDKDLLELYESQAKIQLELHKNECGSECKVDEMLNLERKASKVIIENQEGRIEPLESLVKEYESQIKELQEKCREAENMQGSKLSELLESSNECLKDMQVLRNRREIQEVKEKYANEDSKIKTEKCKLCSDSFHNKMDLSRHLEVKHELETITIEKEPHKRFRKDSTETNFDENKRSSKVAIDPQLKLAVKTHISKN